MIIGRDLISSLGININGAEMTIHWDNAAIPWRDIDITTNDIFVLLQYNAPFNSETNRMKSILDDKYRKAGFKPSQKDPLILIFKKETSYTHY